MALPEKYGLRRVAHFEEVGFKFNQWIDVGYWQRTPYDVEHDHSGDHMSTGSPTPAGTAKRAQPESFRARALSTSLTVKDLQKSLAWYRDVVGFTVDQNMERDGKLRGVALKAGDVRILLNQDDGAKGWDRIKGEGFSLQFTTGQSVDEIAKRIRENGGTLESEPADMPWGARIFRLRDPDGFKLVISSERVAPT